MSTSAMQKRFTEEFKIEAVCHVSERGHKVADVASRLGVSTHSLYQWRKRYAGTDADRQQAGEQFTEICQLKPLKPFTTQPSWAKRAEASAVLNTLFDRRS